MSKKPKRTPQTFYAPSFLDELGKEEWRRIVKVLDFETFTEQDLKTLEIYCMSYSRWRRAEDLLLEEGMTFQTDSGYVQVRPEVSIANSSLKNVQSAAKELGLTSASRIKMNRDSTTKKDEGGEDDDIDKDLDNMISK